MTRGSPGRSDTDQPAARRRRPWWVVVAACALALSSSGFASADGDGSGSGSLNDQQKKVQSQIAGARADLDDASAATVAAHAALDRADAALPAAQSQLAAARGAVVGAQASADASARAATAATAAVAQATAGLAAAQAQLDTRRTVISAYSRATYMAGPVGTATQVLSGADPGDLLDASVRQHNTAAVLQGEIRALQAARFAVAEQHADLVAKQRAAARAARSAAAAAASAQAAVSSAAQATASVQALISSRTSLVQQAASAEASDRDQLAQLQAQSQRIASLLAARPRPTTGPIVGAMGLLWPTTGPVTSGFGYRKDPYTGQFALHAGVDIGAPAGAAIHASQAGVVAYAGPVSGYGNYTCIDHGQGFATCYAHQSLIEVGVGQIVSRGETIGLVGSTGFATGPHLHFETRINGNPVDPLQYFPGMR